MAQSVIEQHPKFNTLPAGQDIIFVVSNNTAVANETKVTVFWFRSVMFFTPACTAVHQIIFNDCSF